MKTDYPEQYMTIKRIIPEIIETFEGMMVDSDRTEMSIKYLKEIEDRVTNIYDKQLEYFDKKLSLYKEGTLEYTMLRVTIVNTILFNTKTVLSEIEDIRNLMKDIHTTNVKYFKQRKRKEVKNEFTRTVKNTINDNNIERMIVYDIYEDYLKGEE